MTVQPENDHSDTDPDSFDDPHVIRKRARFLAATTDLDDAHAHTLAWREAGYSHSGIANQVDATEATVAARLDRVTAQYGIAAVLSKQPQERGRTPLTPVTREEVAAFPSQTRAEWRALALEFPDRAPDWFDPPADDADGEDSHDDVGDADTGKGGTGE